MRQELRGGRFEQKSEELYKGRLDRVLHRQDQRPIRIVDEETARTFLTWQKLVPCDASDAAPRVKLGELCIFTWREMPTVVEDGRRHLKNLGKFSQLLKGRERRSDLQALPRERKVVRLVPNRLPTIETAIRQAKHIQDRYKEEEREQLDLIAERISSIQSQVLGREINRDNLVAQADLIAQFLKESGLAKSQKEAKTKIVARLRKVFELDSIGRLNPLVQRIRLLSALLNQVNLEAFSVLVREKFSAIAGVLLMEREVTRQEISGAADGLNRMMGFDKRGVGAFVEGLNLRTSEGGIKGMTVVLHEIAKLLAEPRVSPYLGPSRVAGIALWGCRAKKVEENRKIIGGEKEVEVLLGPNFLSARQLIQEGRFREAKETAEKYVFEPLKRLLQETEDIGLEKKEGE